MRCSTPINFIKHHITQEPQLLHIYLYEFLNGPNLNFIVLATSVCPSVHPHFLSAQYLLVRLDAFLCRLRSMVNTWITTPSVLASASSGSHTFGFQSITFEGMHQFQSKFTKG